MKSRVTPHLIDLTFDAALRSFWRKQALATFLQRSGIQGLPNWLPEEPKRSYLQRVFQLLPSTDDGKAKIVELARNLAEQTSFPDLLGWEDSAEKLDSAQRSISALKGYLQEQEHDLLTEQQRKEAREKLREAQAHARASQQTLQSLSERLTELSTDLGTADAGRDFEKWFYDLMDFSEITSRKPYISNGRQIDGSITLGDTTYLVECKFTTEQSGAPDIDIFRSKVESKADNTMGIFVSISGFSSVAIQEASGRKSPLLLLDHAHLYRILSGISSFRDVVERVRLHSSQTGEAFLSVNGFDG